jgi:transcriptional regulator with XRE-family HTH domain
MAWMDYPFTTGSSTAVATLEQKFGWVVRRLRKSAGIAQEKLATMAGLHRTQVGLIELGRRGVTLPIVQKLADALGTTMAKLVAAVEAEGDEPGPEPEGPRAGRPRKSPAKD